MIWIRAFIITLALFVVGACAEAPIPEAPGLTNSNAAWLYVYRPYQMFHSLNPEQPFVYVNGGQIGTLGVGDMLGRRFTPGTYQVSIRSSILFMPGTETAAIKVKLEAGKTYYVRYSYDMSGIVPLPSGAAFEGGSSLVQVDEKTGQAKK